METVFFILLSLGAVLALGILACNLLVVWTTRRVCFDDVEAVPSHEYAMVLGTAARRADGRENRYFVRRMRAAAELYKAGKVKKVIVSGAKNALGQDEPQEMRSALVSLGIPYESILLDETGFRTLLSVKAVRQDFNLNAIVFISQRFHNERAVFLARRLGIKAMGYNAEAVHGGKAPIVTFREWFGRVRAVWDAICMK